MTTQKPNSLAVLSLLMYVVRTDDAERREFGSFSTLAEVRAWGRAHGYVLRRVAPGDLGHCHNLVAR